MNKNTFYKFVVLIHHILWSHLTFTSTHSSPSATAAYLSHCSAMWWVSSGLGFLFFMLTRKTSAYLSLGAETAINPVYLNPIAVTLITERRVA